jgi:hypothetical protein
MAVQFDRQYRFSAGKAGSPGFEVGTADPVGLHVYFNIQKVDVSAANTSKITLWNLNAPHLATLNEKDCIVTLRAGYGSTMPLIFVGAISHIETVIDGSDRMTEIEAVDGRIELRDTYVSLSYKGKINTKKIAQDIAAQMGVTVTFSYNATYADLPNGFAFVGAAKNALDKLCAPTGLAWEIQNGILQVKRKGDVMSRQAFVLSPDSGLIGIPKRLTEGAENGEDKNKTGWEVVYLLNGAIGVGDYVKIESKTVTGFFRVHSVEHDGDNMEGDWLSTARLYEVYPAPASATLAEESTEIKAGSKVKIKPGARYYSGQNIPAWVMADTWIVLQVKGDRAVINKNVSGTHSIMSPIHVNDLIPV